MLGAEDEAAAAAVVAADGEGERPVAGGVGAEGGQEIWLESEEMSV